MSVNNTASRNYYNDFILEPIYTKESLNQLDLNSIRPLKIDNGWDICVEYKSSTPINQLLSDLSSGVDELLFLDHKNFDLKELGELEKSKKNSLLTFNLEDDYLDFIGQLEQYDLSNFKICFNCDPVKRVFQNRTIKEKLPIELDNLKKLIFKSKNYENSICIDSKIINHSGAAESQELAYSISTALFYLRELTSRGIDIKDIAKKLSFSLAIGPNLLFSCAKIRSLKILWKKILTACGIDNDLNVKIHVRTSERELTVQDINVNILRGTTTAWAGAIGGATSITVLPYNYLVGQSQLSHRLAKNTQLILREEAKIACVLDPAGGSYYIENLTHKITQKAWEHFRQIESENGIINYILSEQLDQDIDKVWKQREQNIRKRKDKITGVSEFPILTNDAIPNQINEKLPRRWSHQFDKLRNLSDQFLKAKGYRPLAALYTIGEPATHINRSIFAENFLTAGGIEVTKSIDSFHKTDIALISASDELYLNQGAELIKTLKESGKKYLILAGRPQDHMKEWPIDNYIYLGKDLVESIEDIYFQALEVKNAN